MSPRAWKEGCLALPGVGVSVLPKVVCPVCSAAYVALVSSLGFGFLSSTRYLLPLTFVLLAVTIGAFGFRASSRRGRGPVWVGTIAAGCVMIGKFGVESTTMTYAGVVLLVAASIWNAVPRRHSHDFCRACLPTESGDQRSEGR